MERKYLKQPLKLTILNWQKVPFGPGVTFDNSSCVCVFKVFNQLLHQHSRPMLLKRMMLKVWQQPKQILKYSIQIYVHVRANKHNNNKQNFVSIFIIFSFILTCFSYSYNHNIFPVFSNHRFKLATKNSETYKITELHSSKQKTKLIPSSNVFMPFCS